MNPFTLHTQQQGVSYTEHMIFAMGIAYRLLRSVIAFTLHAVFPFLNIKTEVDLDSTVAFIEERNNWIEDKKRNRVQNDLIKEGESFNSSDIMQLIIK